MTYSIFGSWDWGGCSKDTSSSGTGVYDAVIDKYDNVQIDNPGGAYDGAWIRQMQQGVDKDTYVYLDGQGHDTGDTVDIRYDSKGCDVDTVVVDANDFSGNFCLNVSSMQTIDKLYMSNVVSFTELDCNGKAISPVYSQDNVYGGGETGDQNGGEFGEGTYDLKDGGTYQVCYIDRNGNEQTITLKAHVDHGDESIISIDYVDSTPPPPPPPVCFTRGTRIEVEGGFKLVEDLRPGDRVATKDNGFQPLQWIARRRISAGELARNSDLKPIRIRAGALGENMPAQDLLVSPQHRMLVTDWRCEALFGETEMLAPAKALVNDSTVTVEHGAEEVEYFHFMFRQHEIVFANGVESESFHPGDFGLSTLDQAALEELFLVFPHLEQDVDAFGAPARPVLRTFEARAMMSA